MSPRLSTIFAGMALWAAFLGLVVKHFSLGHGGAAMFLAATAVVIFLILAVALRAQGK